MTTDSKLPMLLTAYGVPYTMGYIPSADGAPNPTPLTALQLMDKAVELGLSGIELPLTTRVPSFEGRVVELPLGCDDLGAELRSRGLSVVADYGVIVDTTAEHFADYLRTAQRLGASVVRATLSNMLCGDRRTCAEGWPARLSAVATRLRDVLPVAEELGISIAMENHQDATTDDLIALHELSGGSAAYGITFDTGNPLAMGEDPVEAARRLAHLVRHVHLKDYTIHFAPEGYRLVRCAAGDGVIDFPSILKFLGFNSPPSQVEDSLWRGGGRGRVEVQPTNCLLPGIEIAAQATRTIPILDPGWWSTYPNREAHDPPALRILRSKGRPLDEPYSSAWERGEPPDAVLREEWSVLTRSVAYFRSLLSN
jgi:sugar phosphate isomerase/epimerase